MNRLAQLVSFGILLNLAANTPSFAAPLTLLNEDFNDISDWTDLSTAITWGNNTQATSAFAINNGAVQLTSDAFNYTNFTQSDGLKTFTALDQKFLNPVNHASSIVTIDFRARWNSVANSGSGENGRFIISLNYDYPEGGLDTTLNDKFDDFDQAWWARPAYHLRMRGGSASNPQGTTLLQYGGGLTSAGEYESYDNPLTPQTPDWWLPGFISGAGGVSPGTAADYPNNSWVATQKGVASTSFTNYRYVITPYAQEFWVDANNNGLFEINELAAMMPLPITNDNGAPLYQYFPTFEGIRLYWRGAGGESKGQVFLENLIVTVDSLTSSSTEQTDSSVAQDNGDTSSTPVTDSSVTQGSGDMSDTDGIDLSVTQDSNSVSDTEATEPSIAQDNGDTSSIQETDSTVTQGSADISDTGEIDLSVTQDSNSTSTTEETESSVTQENGNTSSSSLLESSGDVDELTLFEMPPTIEPVSALVFSPEQLAVNYTSTSASLQATKSVTQSASVPEPSQTLGLLGLAGLGVLSRHHHKRAKPL